MCASDPGPAGGVADRLGSTDAILCDGICCDGYIWKYLWDDLAAGDAALPLELPGPRPLGAARRSGRIDTPTHADDLGAVRVHMGDGPVVLVGHSMGCQVVLEAYRQRPEKIRGLVLLCGSSGRVTQTFHGNDLLARVLPRLLRVVESRPGLMRGIWSRIPVRDRAQSRAGHRRGGQEPARSR